METLFRTAQAKKFGKRADFRAVLDVIDGEHTITRLPEVLQITPNTPEGNAETSVCFLFKNGSVISWNCDSAFALLEKNADVLFSPANEHPVHEQFQYEFSDGDFKIVNDRFMVPSNDLRALLSVSYAISKSLQIEDSEQKVTEVSKRVSHLPTELMNRGRTALTGKEIKKLIGSILELQFTVSTAGLAEDRPDMFWDEPRLGHFYTKTAVHMEIDDRWNVLYEKLAALHSAIEVLRDEVNTRQSHRLEWVIIILIVIEILWALAERIAA